MARVDCHSSVRSLCALAFSALAVIALCASERATANSPADLGQLLEQSDSIKLSDPKQFAANMAELDARASLLRPSQHEYLEYLHAWQASYAGDYAKAISQLSDLTDRAKDVTVQVRALATLVNIYALASRYEPGFSQLNKLLDRLPAVTDKSARQQALEVAAYMYDVVGENDLSLSYAQRLLDENDSSRSSCRGGLLKLQALFKRGSLKSDSSMFQESLGACQQHGEIFFVNWIRAYEARSYLSENKVDPAIQVLERYYTDVQKMRYPRGISEWDTLMASAYQRRGDLASAKKHALLALENGVKNQPTEPIVTSYRILYEIAARQGDTAEALSYLEKYVSADKGYLDDVGARQLAYERAKHENASNKLQIEALNQENKLLQLQRQLDNKAAEASRLYIALLLVVVLFIGLWAYRTKRSQLHFMKLSQIDGLTGISNRPRFIELAESVLDAAQKSNQQVSVVLCDLDYFKSINDRYGHAAGDHVLRETVHACKAHLRVSDIFGRFGGEEFGIVLPGCGLEDAKQRAERLRLAMHAISPQYDGEKCPVSASFGVTTTDLSGYELRQLLAHADWALYRAKADGRDRVVPYEAGAVDSSTTPPLSSDLRNASRA